MSALSRGIAFRDLAQDWGQHLLDQRQTSEGSEKAL